jgi:hypothetical protein
MFNVQEVLKKPLTTLFKGFFLETLKSLTAKGFCSIILIKTRKGGLK